MIANPSALTGMMAFDTWSRNTNVMRATAEQRARREAAKAAVEKRK